VRTHAATTVTHGGLAAEVDVELVPLIVETWTAGIATIHSCQDVGENLAQLVDRLPHLADLARRETGRSSIGFAGVGPLLAFLDAMANSGRRDELYERMVHFAAPDAWQLVIGVLDEGLRGQGGEEDQPSRLAAASFQVRFPRSDVGEMTERMRRHNRGEAVALGRPAFAAVTAEDPT
jgi:hypothetical protein